MNHFFSIIIPLYNKKPFIGRAVDSVIEQKYKDWELIVVNDGSTDGGEKIVEKYSDPRIMLVCQQNKGVSAARNKGVSLAKYDHVTFLDGDDTWEPDYLNELNYLITKYPDCGIWGINHRFVRENGEVRVNPAGMREEGFPDGIIQDYFTLFAKKGKSPFSNSGCCYPKKLFLETGGYREGVALTEDSDLWCRIAMDHPVAFSAKELVNYYFQSPGNTRSGFRAEDYQVSKTLQEGLKEGRIRTEMIRGARRLIAFQQLSLAKRAVLTGHKPFALRKSLEWKCLRYYPWYPVLFAGLILVPKDWINAR
jgi:glycosyltransferase involved in cell wall biosynthesis